MLAVYNAWFEMLHPARDHVIMFVYPSKLGRTVVSFNYTLFCFVGGCERLRDVFTLCTSIAEVTRWSDHWQYYY